MARVAVVWLIIAALSCSSKDRVTPPHRGATTDATIASTVEMAPLGTATTAPSAWSETAPTMYLGRELAEPMSFLGADWLDRPEREKEEQPEHMLDVLAIHEGDTVADVGAGSGYYSERLARRIGSRGRVIATDIQPEMIALIQMRIAQKGLSRIETVLATPSDAKLPRAAIDLVLMVDVYHELPKPKETLAQVKAALRSDGRLALVEFRGEDPAVPIKEEHKMTLPQIRKELAAGGFAITKVDESLPWQRVVIARPDP